MDNIKLDKQKKIDEVYCFACGSTIKREAEICPKCGVNKKKRKTTTQAEVYCIACRQVLKRDAELCPHCGVRQFSNLLVIKNIFAIISLVLGIICIIRSILLFSIYLLPFSSPISSVTVERGGYSYILSAEYISPIQLYLGNVLPLAIWVIFSFVFGSISYSKYKSKLAFTGLLLSVISLGLILISLVAAINIQTRI